MCNLLITKWTQIHEDTWNQSLHIGQDDEDGDILTGHETPGNKRIDRLFHFPKEMIADHERRK